MDTVTDTSWLSDEQLELMRAHVPVVYVEAVPVRVDVLGNVTRIGLLLRVASDGSISRLVVSGRVQFGERGAEGDGADALSTGSRCAADRRDAHHAARVACR